MVSRLAIIDLSFTWPPDGGARTDVREVAIRLARTHDIMLFVPWIEGWAKLGGKWLRWPLDRTRFFWKGKISDDVGISITRVPFGPLTFSAKHVGGQFRRVVEAWNPDHLFIADGWYLKPYVTLALADMRPVVRIYAHEMLCLKGNGFFYRWGKACYRNYLNLKPATHARCVACTSAFYFSYPSPTWIHEFLTSRAYLPSYPHTVTQALQAARAVVVYNDFTAQRVRPFSRDVRIVPSGVDTAHFKAANGGPKHEGKKVILAMGRVEEPRKGLKVLLKACRVLRAKRNDFELWLTKKSSTSSDWIRPLGWWPYQKMPELYSQVDIAVVPSLWPEPHGIVALEAMACGVPTVVSKIGGLMELCRDGVDGFQVEPGNAVELANRLKFLLDDSTLRREVGNRGRTTVERRFTWDRIVSEEVAPLFA